jgi:hypothetical protein
VFAPKRVTMEPRHQPSEKRQIFSRETLMKEKKGSQRFPTETVSKEFIVYSTSGTKKKELFRLLSH